MTNNNQLAVLKQFANNIQTLTPEAELDFLQIWQPFEAKRKEILTFAGNTEMYLYFVVEGVQRIYYLDDLDREATLVFTYSPSFGGVLDSLLLQTKSAYYYETLTPSIFLRAPINQLLNVMQNHNSIEMMVRKGLTVAMAGLLGRLVELQCYSAELRFTELLKRSPHILQLVPHKYLANYLGMDATNFSKLINKVKI